MKEKILFPLSNLYSINTLNFKLADILLGMTPPAEKTNKQNYKTQKGKTSKA